MLNLERNDPVLAEPDWLTALKYVVFSLQAFANLFLGIFFGFFINVGFPIPYILFVFSLFCLFFVLSLYLQRHGRSTAGWLIHYSLIFCVAFGAFLLAFLPFKLKPGFPFSLMMILLGLLSLFSIGAIHLQWYEKPAYKLLAPIVWLVSLLGAGQLFLSYFGPH